MNCNRCKVWTCGSRSAKLVNSPSGSARRCRADKDKASKFSASRPALPCLTSGSRKMPQVGPRPLGGPGNHCSSSCSSNSWGTSWASSGVVQEALNSSTSAATPLNVRLPLFPLGFCSQWATASAARSGAWQSPASRVNANCKASWQISSLLEFKLAAIQWYLCRICISYLEPMGRRYRGSIKDPRTWAQHQWMGKKQLKSMTHVEQYENNIEQLLYATALSCPPNSGARRGWQHLSSEKPPCQQLSKYSPTLQHAAKVNIFPSQQLPGSKFWKPKA